MVLLEFIRVLPSFTEFNRLLCGITAILSVKLLCFTVLYWFKVNHGFNCSDLPSFFCPLVLVVFALIMGPCYVWQTLIGFYWVFKLFGVVQFWCFQMFWRRSARVSLLHANILPSTNWNVSRHYTAPLGRPQAPPPLVSRPPISDADNGSWNMERLLRLQLIIHRRVLATLPAAMLTLRVAGWVGGWLGGFDRKDGGFSLIGQSR